MVKCWRRTLTTPPPTSLLIIFKSESHFHPVVVTELLVGHNNDQRTSPNMLSDPGSHHVVPEFIMWKVTSAERLSNWWNTYTTYAYQLLFKLMVYYDFYPNGPANSLNTLCKLMLFSVVCYILIFIWAHQKSLLQTIMSHIYNAHFWYSLSHIPVDI